MLRFVGSGRCTVLTHMVSGRMGGRRCRQAALAGNGLRYSPIVSHDFPSSG